MRKENKPVCFRYEIPLTPELRDLAAQVGELCPTVVDKFTTTHAAGNEKSKQKPS